MTFSWWIGACPNSIFLSVDHPVLEFRVSNLYLFKLLNKLGHWTTAELSHLPNECRLSDGSNAFVSFHMLSNLQRL